MEEHSQKVNETKQKIKLWLSNKYNLAFLGIIIFTIAIRLYYFFLTKNQPLWWDEAEYMSTAKSFAGINHFDFTWALNRFPGFPILVSLFYIIGITSEPLLRFLVAFLPAIIAIITVYFVLTSMYSDKRIALISVAIFSLLWEHLFFSNRFMTENISLIFEFLALIVLFKVYLKNKDWGIIKVKCALIWIALFTVICILFRPGNMFFIPIILLFLIILSIYKLPEKYRVTSAIGLFALIILGYIMMVFLAPKYAFVKQFYEYANPLAWINLTVFYVYYQSFIPYLPSVLFYTFLIGIMLALGRIIIFPEGLKKLSRDVADNNYKADIFNLILIAGFSFFFIVMLRSNGVSSRWFFAILPGLFAFTAKGLIKLGEFIQSIGNIKYLSLIVVILILGLGVYTQYNHVDGLIRNKLDSYSQVKDSGLWLKENTGLQDTIISASLTQHRYYSERKIKDFYVNGSNENESVFNEMIFNSKPRYIVISIFEPGFTPQWAYTWPEKHNETIKPVQIYYDTRNNKQPVLVIYEINSNFY